MKTKKFEKKLNLNKKTIVDLDQGAMTRVLGGGSKNFCTQGACTKKCETFPILECTTGCNYPN